MTAELIYVYGICRRPDFALALPLGLERETVMVSVDQLTAVIEPGLDVAAIQADDQRLLTAVLSHDRVVCELFQAIPILPMRFGTQIPSRELLLQHLETHHASYLDKLKRLAYRGEYQLKLTPKPIILPPLPEELKGRDYFLAKKQRLQDQTQLQQLQQQDLQNFLDQLHSTYPELVHESSQEGTTKLYLLLEPAAAEQLQQQAQTWIGQTPHWQLSLSEPLPPYHFV